MPFFIYLFCLSLLSCNLYASETLIYKEIDKQGNVRFSDRSQNHTQPINIQINNVTPARIEKEIKKEVKSQQIKIIAHEINIIFPRDDMSIRSNNGLLNVQVNISPRMQQTYRLQLFIDATKVGKAQYSTNIRLQNVARGTHSLQVYLLDKNSNVLNKSPIIHIHLLRSTVKR